MAMIQTFFRTLGVLRSILILAAILLMIFVPPAGTIAVIDSWEIVPTVLVPTMTPMVFMVLLLDILMSRILQAGQAEDDAQARQHFAYILRVEIIVCVALVLVWTPYFMAIGR